MFLVLIFQPFSVSWSYQGSSNQPCGCYQNSWCIHRIEPPLLINILSESPSYCRKATKGNTQYRGWEWRNKTAFVCRWHDCLGRKSERIDKKLPDILSDDTTVSGYKVSKQKLVTFLYTSNELMEFEIKNILPLTLAPPKWNTWI